MLKTIIIVTLVAAANAYYSHGPGLPLGHNIHNPSIYQHQQPFGFNHISSPNIPSKALAPSAPIVNPYPVASRFDVHANHLNHNGYLQQHPQQSYYGPHSHVPPPVVAPPTVSYNNNNVIPPSIHNVNHHQALGHGHGLYPHPGHYPSVAYGHSYGHGSYGNGYGHAYSGQHGW